MNIESPKAVLMPVVHQAPAAAEVMVKPESDLKLSTRPSTPVVNVEASGENRILDQENRKQIAALEKMIGMNTSLIVEKDTQRVGYVYKTVDKSTGEVVRIWPQREVASALMALADGDARSMMQGMMVDALV
jgi:uncharacterized FlaG/YvyC family protein